jgi:outer membrane immunogenic protein
MRCRAVSLIAAVAAIGFAQVGSAADMPVKGPLAKAAAAAGIQTWSGFYVGGNFGYSWGDSPTRAAVGPFAPAAPFPFVLSSQQVSFPLKPEGIIGGAQLGYNYRLNNWILGIETDFQLTDQGDNYQRTIAFLGVPCVTVNPGCNLTNTTKIEAKLDWLGTLRGRIGQDWNGMLFYATGGLAYGKVKVSGTNTLVVDELTGLGSATYRTPFSHSTTKAGWALGGGFEGSVGASGWSWKLEYLHIDLGSAVIANSGGGSVPAIAVGPAKFRDDILRFGINYQFAAGSIAR